MAVGACGLGANAERRLPDPLESVVQLPEQ